MGQIINGKELADKILDKVKKEATKHSRKPGLAAILIGEDPASKLYVSLKKKACERCGISFHNYLLPEDCPEKTVLEVIDFLNHDEEIDGILVQLPLPKKFNTDKIIGAIKTTKDVDGFHPDNLNAIIAGKPLIIPGLAHGIMLMLEDTKVKLAGKTATIIANSDVFALPLAYLCEQKHITPTVVKPTDSHLKRITEKSDILIVAVGKPKFITPKLIKKDAIIIDVGTNRTKAGTTIGDVDKRCTPKASFISPVPGGVGPLTVAMLLNNLLLISRKKIIWQKLLA